MRVITGLYKRRILKTLPGQNITRPTGDRAKIGLFNMISQEIADCVCLDLFAGSGALGIEALSRGAKHVTFVEQSKAAAQVILDNLNTLQVPHLKYQLCIQSTEHYLSTRSQAFEKLAASIDLVFADPPYESEWYDTSLDQLHGSNLMKPGGVLILEMNKNRQWDCSHPAWELTGERIYGITKFTFVRKR
jgi:16S rRNA (guanine966-N2)-methyltransferase